MAPKTKKTSKELVIATTTSTTKTSEFDNFGVSMASRTIKIILTLIGEPPIVGDWVFLALFNGNIVVEAKWANNLMLEDCDLPIDLKEPEYQDLVADRPLIFLLRMLGAKGNIEGDPLLHVDNKAGASVDLFSLVLGENLLFYEIPLVNLTSGENVGCSVEIRAETSESVEEPMTKIPLLITLISGHCMPPTKEGSVYLGAICLNRDLDGETTPIVVNFGMSLSDHTATKLVWASASSGGRAAISDIFIPDEDMFIPENIVLESKTECRTIYWNAMKRILVDPEFLKSRLLESFRVEFASVPKVGKIEVRGRYVGYVNASVLLEPGQYGVTTSATLRFYNELELPENANPLLDLPPTSAKASARDTGPVNDEYGHPSFVTIRFDVMEHFTPKPKISTLYEMIRLIPPEGSFFTVEDLDLEPLPESPVIDVRRIRKEGGALAVHKELSGLACRGTVPMNQGIKRTAANRLLMRVRSMVKQFPPGECSIIEWQDIVTRHHAACRRAVTSSFAPQPPPIRQFPKHAISRCRVAGDNRVADVHLRSDLKHFRGPRILLCKALDCLEARNDFDAKKYILEGLNYHPMNKYLLWAYGGQEFDKGPEAWEMAAAALRIAVKVDISDGTSLAIGWAALHALYHFNNNDAAAFIAAKKMRKAFKLPREWRKFVSRWADFSGQEELLWVPGAVSQENPLVIAAAFFLCLRCYSLTEILLSCVENGCSTRGSRQGLKYTPEVDIYYIKASSLLLRRHQYDIAVDITRAGVKLFGPSPIMSQLWLTCLAIERGWDGECESALKVAEKFGSELSPWLLLRSAMSIVKTDARKALQRAARVHKTTPNAYSALAIARIHVFMGEEVKAERWADASVKLEPLLADGWAVLTILALNNRNIDKARTMLRTAHQVGPISSDLDEQIKDLMDLLKLQPMPESLVKNMCFCDCY